MNESMRIKRINGADCTWYMMKFKWLYKKMIIDIAESLFQVC